MRAPTRQRKRDFDPLDHKPHKDVLAMVGRYHYVTSDQVQRLLYPSNPRQWVQKLLRELVVAGLLTDVNFIPKEVKSPGNPATVWSLTSKGHTALKGLSLPAGDLGRYGLKRGDLFQLHTQLVNDTLIAGERFALHNSTAVTLTGFQHEHSLKRLDLRLPLPEGGYSTLTPDGWQHFTIGGKAGSILYECDRGTEDISAFRRKIACYKALFSQQEDLCQRYFGDDPIQVAIVVRTVPTHRVKPARDRGSDLLEFAQRELARSPGWGSLFSFAVHDPATSDPTWFFTDKHWYSPFEDTPHALIPAESVVS